VASFLAGGRIGGDGDAAREGVAAVGRDVPSLVHGENAFLPRGTVNQSGHALVFAHGKEKKASAEAANTRP